MIPPHISASVAVPLVGIYTLVTAPALADSRAIARYTHPQPPKPFLAVFPSSLLSDMSTWESSSRSRRPCTSLWSLWRSSWFMFSFYNLYFIYLADRYSDHSQSVSCCTNHLTIWSPLDHFMQILGFSSWFAILPWVLPSVILTL